MSFNLNDSQPTSGSTYQATNPADSNASTATPLIDENGQAIPSQETTKIFHRHGGVNAAELSYENLDTQESISFNSQQLGLLQTSVSYKFDAQFPGLITPNEFNPATAVNGNAVTGLTGQALLTTLFNNVGQNTQDIQTAAQTVLNTLASNNIARVVLADFLTHISTALQLLQKTLHDLQIGDIQKAQTDQQGLLDELQGRRVQEKANEEKIDEQRQKQKKADNASLALKIVGPIISALATIAGVLISVATLGIGTPAGVAVVAIGVAVGVALTAYSIADSVSNVTQQVVSAFNDAISNLVPVPPNSEEKQKAVKFAIIAVIAAALLVVIVASLATGSGEAAIANAATEVTVQAVKQAILEGIRQLATQLLLTTVLSSNALPELVTAILKSFNLSGQALEAAQIIITVLETAIIIAALAKGGGGSGLNSIKDAASGLKDSASDAIKTLSSTLQNIADNGLQGVRDTAEAISSEIVDSIKAVANQALSIIDDIKNIPQSIKDSFHAFVDLLSTNLGRLQFFVGIAKASPSVANAIGGAIQGSILLQLANILKEQGDIQAAEALLQVLIQILQRIISKLQGSAANLGDAIADVAKDIQSLYSAAGQSVGGLATSVLPQGSV